MSVDKVTFEGRFFLAALCIVSLVFIGLLKPFWGAIFWAVALSLIFYPFYQRLMRRWPGKPAKMALLTLLVCVIMLVLPAAFLGASLISEAVSVYGRIKDGQFDLNTYFNQMKHGFPAIQALLEKSGYDFGHVKSKLGELAMSGSEWVAMNAFAVGQNAFSLVLNAVLTLYLTFFLLRDGRMLVALIVKALPMGDQRELLLVEKFAGVLRATIKGSLFVAVLQGALGGTIFAILGIPSALLWGAIMVFAAFIPAVGTALVWAPVALYLFATDEIVSGFVLVGFGAGIISTIDSVLRPILVGRDAKMPDYLVLLSTLGGLSMFGIHGLVLGPLMAALFLAFWEIFMREYDAGGAM